MRRKEAGERRKAVILVSGGMDSCVTAATAIKDGYQPAFLHINYGQQTESRELKAFNKIAYHYQVEQKLVVDISHLSEIGASCLTDGNIEVPDADLESDDIPISYVPFRNANILSAATSWAEVLGAKTIYVGAVEEDSSGYPDCRRSFFDVFEHTIDTGTKPGTQIKIITPLIHLSKKEIVEWILAENLPVRMQLQMHKMLWSPEEKGV